LPILFSTTIVSFLLGIATGRSQEKITVTRTIKSVIMMFKSRNTKRNIKKFIFFLIFMMSKSRSTKRTSKISYSS
jgi:hypothetical protein